MKRRSGSAAFSLVEAALALGIFATIGVSLIGFLGSGLKVTRDALDDAETTMLIENVQARLALDVAWPGKSLTRLYDQRGVEVKEESAASFRVVLQKIAGPGFSSNYFETYRVTAERLPQKSSAGTWQLKRTRLAQGQPVLP